MRNDTPVGSETVHGKISRLGDDLSNRVTYLIMASQLSGTRLPQMIRATRLHEHNITPIIRRCTGKMDSGEQRPLLEWPRLDNSIPSICFHPKAFPVNHNSATPGWWRLSQLSRPAETISSSDHGYPYLPLFSPTFSVPHSTLSCYHRHHFCYSPYHQTCLNVFDQCKHKKLDPTV
jgi:hypothetical protein